MTIFVLYREYGADEGCDAPEGVVLTEREALEWMAKEPETNAYSEFEIEEPK